MKISVDLGCGSSPKNPFNAEKLVGVDKVKLDNILQADLALQQIPLPDCSCDYVTAFDFIEHIPRQSSVEPSANPFINLMNDIYRVLKPGGIFLHKTPAYPHQEAFMDPTHVNIITEKTIIYFAKVLDQNQSDVYEFLRPIASSYGINHTFVLDYSKWDGFHLIQQVRK